MPKTTTHALIWSAEGQTYTWRDGNGPDRPGSGPAWVEWLAGQPSFAFHGRAGQITLLKEARKSGGAGYWYAYRRQGRETIKRYAGRTTDLTLERLEEIAAALNPPGAGPATPFGEQTAKAPETTSPRARGQAPLLVPKLQPPRLHSVLIRREHLLAQLGAGLERRLIVVNAPAGCGKTTLIRQWLTEGETQPGFPAVAWVGLDAGDNDPVRFWRYTLTAAAPFLPDQGQAALALLDAPPQLPFKQSPVEAALTTLLNSWAQGGLPGLLVLEDYHVITAPQVHETVAFLLEHLPACGHLLIMTRQHPPLPLARLQALGDLVEITPNDLLFTAEETQRFLQQATPVPLAPERIAAIEQRVEGWPAGLRLLAAALEGRTDPQTVETIVRTFAGNQQRMQEYFLGEFLHDLPAPVQQFLLETSVLTRLTADLCATVTGRADSPTLLDAMDHGNVLLEPLDNGWYRYHGLFAQAMREEARRRLGAATLRALSGRASRWYAEHDLPAEAIEAALVAEEMEEAARLIQRLCNAERLIMGQHLLPHVPGFHTLRRWLDQLPDAIFATYPSLWLIQAVALLFVFLLDHTPLNEAASPQIELALDRAEQAFRDRDDQAGLGEIFAFRSMLRRQRGEFSAAAEWAHEALARLPPGDLAARALSLNSLGFLEVQSGRLAVAEDVFRQALALCERLGNRAFVRANMGMLSWALYEQGRLHEGAALMKRMLAEARDQQDIDDIARAQQGLAKMSYQWNDLDKAQRRIAESLEMSARLAHESDVLLTAELVQAQIEAARGEQAAALARCAGLVTRLENYNSAAQYQVYRRARAIQARLHLAAGDLTAVQHWAAGRDPAWAEMAQAEQEREARIVARLRIAEGKAAETLAGLETALYAARKNGNGRTALKNQVLLALAYSAARRLPDARHHLQAALISAHPEGYIRLFVDEGEPLAALLRGLLPALQEKPLVLYARSLLHACAGPAHPTRPAATPDSLSEQEQRVLRLLAAGRSNPEIAAALVISINTVKAHVKNIYRKLDVANRLEAGAAAHRLHLQ